MQITYLWAVTELPAAAHITRTGRISACPTRRVFCSARRSYRTTNRHTTVSYTASAKQRQRPPHLDALKKVKQSKYMYLTLTKIVQKTHTHAD